MKRFIILMGLLACSFIFSGCGIMPETSQLITQPTTAGVNMNSNMNLLKEVEKFLPANAAVYTPSSPAGTSGIQQLDINNDGVQEIFLTYKVNGTPGEIGAIVLTEEDGQLKKLWDQEGPGYDIDYVAFKDITGDGHVEILIGWRIGGSAGSDLNIYTTKNGEFKNLSSIGYNKLELFEFQTKQMSSPETYFATWVKDTGDVFMVDVVKWADGDFLPATEVYQVYFPKIVDYYSVRVKETPDAKIYWYYLADAQLKSGLYEDALNSINKGLTSKLDYSPTEEQVSALKKLVMEMKEHEEAFQYQHPYYPFTFTIPTTWNGKFTIEDFVKQEDEKIMNVSYKMTNGENELLFSIFMYDEEKWGNEGKEDSEFTLLGIKNGKAFVLKSTGENSKTGSFMKDIPTIVNSFSFDVAYKVEFFEEALLRNLALRAREMFWNVRNNGVYDKPFTKDGLDYVFLEEDLDTEQKLFGYLQTEFTLEAAKTYLQQSGLIEVDGKLAKAIADGGSILNWEKAKVVSIKEDENNLNVLWLVPYGESYEVDMIETNFKKEASGWKLNSNPFKVF